MAFSTNVHLPSQNDHYFFENLCKAIDEYSRYEKVLLVGDFNAEISEFCLNSFLYQHELNNLVKEKTCFKNVSNTGCIDLFLTNNAPFFQHTETFSTGLSDFHKLLLTVLKTNQISKSKPREIHYRNDKKFDSLKFNVYLKNAFANDKIESCIKFDEVFMTVLNRHAPFKKKILTANHSSYMSKTLRKAIMRRSYLEKIFLKKTIQYLRAYKKQKNYRSQLYKKERKKFFNGLNLSFVTDNKLFWKTVNPFFSDKGIYGANIKLVEEEEVLQNDSEIARKLNEFFKNAVSTLGITENSFVINEKYKNTSDPVQRAIVKFESRPSISLIKNKITNGNNFKFELVSLSDIELEIRLLNSKKATTHKNIPPKILNQVLRLQ